jgi:hypothetical protein
VAVVTVMTFSARSSVLDDGLIAEDWGSTDTIELPVSSASG